MFINIEKERSAAVSPVQNLPDTFFNLRSAFGIVTKYDDAIFMFR
jgi:hypothetical protein